MENRRYLSSLFFLLPHTLQSKECTKRKWKDPSRSPDCSSAPHLSTSTPPVTVMHYALLPWTVHGGPSFCTCWPTSHHHGTDTVRTKGQRRLKYRLQGIRWPSEDLEHPAWHTHTHTYTHTHTRTDAHAHTHTHTHTYVHTLTCTHSTHTHTHTHTKNKSHQKLEEERVDDKVTDTTHSL
jgi:hypothetical protein